MSARFIALPVAAALAAGLSFPVSARADEPGAAPSQQATFELRVEDPNRGLDPWRAARIEWTTRAANWERSWRAAAVVEERFGQQDHGVELGASLPLDRSWLLDADAGLAPGAEFLPRQRASLRLLRRMDGGWLAGVGLREARYRDERVTAANASIERYAGQWRFAWTANLTRIDGEHAPGHELALDRYYNERDSIGLRLARGEESIALGDGGRIAASVRSAGLVGQHWLSPHWGLRWGAGYVDQDGLYDRAWLQLGLQHAW